MNIRLTKTQVNRLRAYAVRGSLRLYVMHNEDVVLQEQGLIEHGNGYEYIITEKGREFLVSRTRRMNTHNDLIAEFASYIEAKNRRAWCDIELKISERLVRPDVFSLVCTYNLKRMNPRLFEIKVSRSDFLKGIREIDKYAGLYQHAFFVTPASVSSKDEIPEPFGLYHKTDAGFILVKHAKRMKAKMFKPDNWMRLILKSE